MAIVTSKNTLPGTLGVAIYNLKTLLKTAGWTVIESSDGTTYASNNGDTITTGAAGAGGFANTRAWFRIRMGGGATREFIFQWISATTLRIKYSAAGFTAGGANATTTPAGGAGDNNAVLGGGTDAAPTGTDLLGTINRVSYWADNAAPYGWGMHGWSGVGANTFALVLDALISGTYPVAEPEPYVVWVAANTPNFGVYSTSTNGSLNAGWYARGTGSAAFLAIGSGFYTGAPFFNNSATGIPTGQFGINPFTSKDDNIPIIYARTSAVANPGYKGVSQYLQWIGMQRANLSTQTINTALDRIIIGNFSVPWGTDGVAPLL